jgi:hypothetical protein
VDCDTAPNDPEFLSWCLHQLGVSRQKFTTVLPDFLVISPPKTGTTWLAANLRCHPDIFVPDAKEVRYFSTFLPWLDLNWYLDHFKPAGSRAKGEASPSYAMLSLPRIRLIRRLIPRVKLIFLMRDPVSRAWSHAKHTWRFREANFMDRGDHFDAVTEEQWRENFTHDWPLACGDYLGQLRRWLSVFPRENFYVGFYETIASDPQALLREIFTFLGVHPYADFSRFPMAERILPGLAGEPLASMEAALHGLLHDRSSELVSFLANELKLNVPPGWGRTLQARKASGPARAFPGDFDDAALSRLLGLEEGFPSARCGVVDGYRGYNIFFRKGCFYALEDGLGPARPEEIDEEELKAHRENGGCFTATSLPEIKDFVDHHRFVRAQAEIEETRRRVAHLEEGLREAMGALGRMESRLVQLRPWYARLASMLRRARRRYRPLSSPREMLVP